MLNNVWTILKVMSVSFEQSLETSIYYLRREVSMLLMVL
jgi:hypothetical protein